MTTGLPEFNETIKLAFHFLSSRSIALFYLSGRFGCKWIRKFTKLHPKNQMFVVKGSIKSFV